MDQWENRTPGKVLERSPERGGGFSGLKIVEHIKESVREQGYSKMRLRPFSQGPIYIVRGKFRAEPSEREEKGPFLDEN